MKLYIFSFTHNSTSYFRTPRLPSRTSGRSTIFILILLFLASYVPLNTKNSDRNSDHIKNKCKSYLNNIQCTERPFRCRVKFESHPAHFFITHCIPAYYKVLFFYIQNHTSLISSDLHIQHLQFLADKWRAGLYICYDNSNNYNSFVIIIPIYVTKDRMRGSMSNTRRTHFNS